MCAFVSDHRAADVPLGEETGACVAQHVAKRFMSMLQRASIATGLRTLAPLCCVCIRARSASVVCVAGRDEAMKPSLHRRVSIARIRWSSAPSNSSVFEWARSVQSSFAVSACRKVSRDEVSMWCMPHITLAVSSGRGTHATAHGPERAGA